MFIVWWLLFGLIVGALARLLVPGPSGFQGCLPTIVLGMLGSALGGFIGRWIGMYQDEPIHGAGIFMSIIGAVLVILIYQALVGRKKP